jgi:methylglyoxal/glyoxal reductase
VSNFLEYHLHDLGTTPVVNQFEFHPLLIQPNLLSYCRAHNIQPEAYTPILRGSVGKLPVIAEIAEKYDKSPVQVTLRWDLQKGVVTIPKSSKKERIFSNADIFDFSLTDEDMARIDGLDTGSRTGDHPDSF